MTPFCASNFPHIPGRTAPRRPGTLLDNQPSPQEVLAGVEGAFRVAWSSGEGRALHRALLRLLRCCQRTQELAAALAEQVSVSLKAVQIPSQRSVSHVQGREALE